jgi:ubiquinone/menaquinone biosynthesis C-methylase UbiE
MSEMKFYDQRSASKLSTSDNPEMVRLVRRIVDWCEMRPGGRVLDFGCYDGYIGSRLARQVGAFPVEVDISLVALQKIKSDDALNLQLVVNDGKGLPFPDAVFDTVVCSEILEHVTDLESLMSEIRRVMKPGGKLYATMPNQLDRVLPVLRPLCRRVDEIEGHLRRLTADEFVGLAGQNGLRVAHLRHRGFILSALWYRTLIYNDRFKERAVSMIDQDDRRASRILRSTAFMAMRGYLYGDDLFGRWDRCMGIDAVFVCPE